MKDLKTSTFISSTFTDVSLEMNNYDVDESAYNLVDDVDYIYIGLYKSFKNLYIEVKEQTVAGIMTVEYFDGSIWAELDVTDETKALSRSGFLRWDQDLSTVDINSNDLFHIRMTGTMTGVLNGINLVFSNDNDLREHYRNINDFLGNDTTFIALHQASRKDLIQDIRNSGNVKISSIDGLVSDLTVWDFLNPQQLRNASLYLTLSKIFSGVSDNSEGKFFQLASSFKKKSAQSFETFLLNIDKDDDGIKSDIESYESVNRTRIIQV